MHPALRAQYLQRLGLTAYVPRSAVEEQPQSVAPTVCWEGPADASLIFLFQSDAPSIDWTHPSYQLLKKIRDAVTVPGLFSALCFSTVAPIVLPNTLKQVSIISFGRGLTQSAAARTIHTLPLVELEHNDAAKRALWQELKAMKATYGC